jgi:hypothetical protein
VNDQERRAGRRARALSIIEGVAKWMLISEPVNRRSPSDLRRQGRKLIEALDELRERHE